MKINLFNQDPHAVALLAGTVIFQAGDPGDKMYAVIEGTVDITLDGRLIESIGPGGVFGEMALIDELPRSASATVGTDARVVGIDRNRFLFMVQQTPYFSLQLLSIITTRLRRATAPSSSSG